jgi:hypothetical protein
LSDRCAARSATIVGLLLASALATLAAPAAVAGPADADGQGFQRWAAEAGKGKGTKLCRFGVARYSPQQTPAHFAVFRQELDWGHRYGLVVAWKDQRRAFRTEATPSESFECPEKPAWEQQKLIKIGPWGDGTRRSVELAVVDDQLVQTYTLEEEPDWAEAVDWEGLKAGGHFTEGNVKRNASLFLLLDPKSPWRAQLPRPQTHVTFQKTPHGGPADSSLTVRADLAGDALRVEMEATDDVLRPPANAKVSDAAFLKADHFELWFCAPGATETCEKKETRQLGVARTADGQLHGRWLQPKGNKEKLPAVAAGTAKGALVVTLPLAQVRHDGQADGELKGELTVSYSDADLEGKGQEAMVATSDVKWGVGSTFGKFVRHAGGARFPEWAGATGLDEDAEFLKSLPPLR